MFIKSLRIVFQNYYFMHLEKLLLFTLVASWSITQDLYYIQILLLILFFGQVSNIILSNFNLR